jgi:Cu(I)/Ag(I) efflux system membrane fusion protein
MALVEREREPRSTAAGRGEVLYYRHPHNPEITSPSPRQDEMGMDYVPVYASGEDAVVRIRPEIQQNLGVRTAQAERGPLWKRIRAFGRVTYDESTLSHIHTRVDGWIEGLRIATAGDHVAKGELLFELYSPTLATAQEEFLQALRAGSAPLIAASRQRLDALGMPSRVVAELERSRRVTPRVAFAAEQDGVVAELNVREGMYVTPATIVVSLAQLDSVWVLAEVFEAQQAWVSAGQTAEIAAAAYPGRVWKGVVDFIYPEIEPQSRALPVRIRLDNADGALRPQMYADVTIYGGPTLPVVFIPREALIRSGSSSRVVIRRADGGFLPRQVVAGLESGDLVEIRTGLEEGETVVTSGQFLIDSEASLKAALDRVSAAETDTGANEP